MTDVELRKNAKELLQKMLPIGTRVYIIRIDEGRQSGIPYHAILCDTDAKQGVQNISEHVARVIYRKRANLIWPNVSGVQGHKYDLVECLAQELHGTDEQLGGKQSITFTEL